MALTIKNLFSLSVSSAVLIAGQAFADAAPSERPATPEEFKAHCPQQGTRTYIGPTGPEGRPFALIQCDVGTVFNRSCKEIDLFLGVRRQEGERLAESLSSRILHTYKEVRPKLSRDHDAKCGPLVS